MRKCFVVVRDNILGEKKFSIFHDSLELAQKEAERLARKERTTFFVLALLGAYYPAEPPICWHPVSDNENNLPT